MDGIAESVEAIGVLIWKGDLSPCDSTILAAMIVSSVKSLLEKTDSCPHHVKLFLDEFSSYHIPDMISFLSESAKQNYSVDYFIQSIGQLKFLFPDDWEEILDASNLVLLAPVICYDDCEFFSKLFGTRRKLFFKRLNLTPQEISLLPEKECVVFLQDGTVLTGKKAFSGFA